MFVSLKFLCGSLISNVIVFVGEAIGRELGDEDGAFMNGMVPL